MGWRGHIVRNSKDGLSTSDTYPQHPRMALDNSTDEARNTTMADKPFLEIGKLIVSADPAGLNDKTSDRLYRMIDYAIKRHDWYEDQRNKALSLAVTLLGLSSFLVAGLLNSEVKLMFWFRVSAGFTLISIVLTALLIIIEYARGAQENYTHRALADIRSWFFAYAIGNQVADAARLSPNNDTANRATIMAAWEKFVTGWMEIQKDATSRATEDLEQVFILYLFQAIRRVSLRRMLRIAMVGGQVAGFSLLVTIACATLRV